MGNLVFCIIITALIAFWLGRKSRPSPFPIEGTEHVAISSMPPLSGTNRVPMNVQRLFTLIFVTGWLIAWSAGIFMALMMFLRTFGSGFSTVFLGGWLMAAIAGWVFAANTIYKILAGLPITARDGRKY